MSGLETAIRSALDRSDRSSAEVRARIYQSARNALEAGLKKQDVRDPAVVTQQRHRLETIIHAIETQERAALRPKVATPPPAAPVISVDAAVRDERDPLAALDDSVDAPPGRETENGRYADDDGLEGLDGLRPERFSGDTRRSSSVSSPDLGGVAPAQPRRGKKEKRVAPERPRKKKRGRFLSFLMVVVTLGAAGGLALWWVETSGLLKSPAERDTGVANPPSTVQGEDFDGGAGLKTLGNASGFSGDWIDVFSPGQPASARSAATAEPVSDDSGQRLRITSSTAEAEGDVLVEIPADVLEQLSGKTSTVAVSVRSSSDKPTQFSIECEFSSIGDCGRHRFTANDEKSDMLFKVSFDRSLAPSAPGHIVINSDVTGKGNSLYLYAIRVLPGQ